MPGPRTCRRRVQVADVTRVTRNTVLALLCEVAQAAANFAGAARGVAGGPLRLGQCQQPLQVSGLRLVASYTVRKARGELKVSMTIAACMCVSHQVS